MLDITNYINNDFKPFESNQSIAFIQDFFADLTFSHFPVLDEGIYIGSIAADDVVTFDLNKTPKDYKYTLEGFFARSNMIWLDVLEVFAQNRTNLIPVLDETNKYVGYYELNDIVQFFAETPFLREQGGIIIVEKSIKDFLVNKKHTNDLNKKELNGLINSSKERINFIIKKLPKVDIKEEPI
jgi:predicted transcriptional regulator